MIGRDSSRGLELRKQHREAHLANLQPLADSGGVSYAGPLIDAQSQPCGSVIVFEAEDLSAAQAFAATDPYVVQGVFASHEVIETRKVHPQDD
ncbi:MAG: YciI family protein [bacterium]|nr:YciI family protein [bacterium]